MSRFYELAMRLGRCSGCHQLAERSFFWRGRQFPVCARCTGVYLGQLLGLLGYFFRRRLPLWALFGLCGVMLLDWALQASKHLPSTNFRRLITGLLCGFALGQLFLLGLIALGRLMKL